jgi:2-polyprenyl-3-methyl-5-hydroxy-6-metoxy-1,4-benzoquinol methylase
MTQHAPDQPAAWVIENVGFIRDGGRVLDVACGRGRNAVFLARSGFSVVAIDRREEAIRELLLWAHATGVAVDARVLDLEADVVPIEKDHFDAVVVINYLYRPLIPTLIESLAPNGVLIYETFTIGQALRGHPRNPAYLLQDRELRELVKPLEMLRWREEDVEGKLVASIVAQRR